ncbi:hypothetical protein YC2023_010561 [Brassica napus]
MVDKQGVVRQVYKGLICLTRRTMVEWKIGHSTLRLYIPSASPSPVGPMRRGNEDWTQSRGVYSSTEEISLRRMKLVSQYKKQYKERRRYWRGPRQQRKERNRGRPWGLGKRSGQVDDSRWGKQVVGISVAATRGKTDSG